MFIFRFFQLHYTDHCQSALRELWVKDKSKKQTEKWMRMSWQSKTVTQDDYNITTKLRPYNISNTNQDVFDPSTHCW